MDLALNHLRSHRAEVWRSELSVRFGSDDSWTPITAFGCSDLHPEAKSQRRVRNKSSLRILSCRLQRIPARDDSEQFLVAGPCVRD